MDKIRKEIIEIVNRIIPGAHGDVLIGVGGIMDSVTALRFITMIEDHFGVDIAEDELALECFSTVDSLTEYLSRVVN